MSRKKSEVPDDPELRNEYFTYFAASSLFDADFLLIYLDEQISAESGIPTLNQLLQHQECQEKKLKLQNFTSVKPIAVEALGEQARVLGGPNANMLIKDPELYYGFWGMQYNSVMDISPNPAYATLISWLLRVAGRDPLPPDKEGKPHKPPPHRIMFLTSATDSHCLSEILDRAQRAPALRKQNLELQGSITSWMCTRLCTKLQWHWIPSFRFPVDDFMRVRRQMSRVGVPLDSAAPSNEYGLKNLATLYGPTVLAAQKHAEATRAAAAEELRKRRAEAAKAIADKAAGKEEPKKEGGSRSEAPEKPAAPRAPQVQPQTSFVPTCTHVTCPRCGAPARPWIKPVGAKGCAVPQSVKTWTSQVVKECVEDCDENAAKFLLERHYNYLEPGKKPPRPRGGVRQKFVIVEIGSGGKSDTVRAESERLMLNSRGTVGLVRLVKNEAGLARDTSNDLKAIEQAKAEGVDFNPEAAYYPILCSTLTEGIGSLNDALDARLDWIADWDDPKKRQDRYKPKK